MFEKENPTPSAPPPAQPAYSAPTEVHTMPERFLDTNAPVGGGPSPSSGRGRRVLILVVVAVVVGALGAGAWFYFTKLSKQTNTNTIANTNAIRNTRNTNVNTNLNANANANDNGNANLNTNLNTNTNTNGNINTNGNVNTNTNTNTGTTGTPLQSSADADSDGLTDVEEPVYGTQGSANDTDGDGFIDGMRVLSSGSIEGEVYAGYCPTKTGAVRLDAAECGVIRSYTNTTHGYEMWIPQNWLAQPTTSDNKTVIVTPDILTSEFFEVRILDNPTQITAKTYYLNLNPGVDPSRIKDVSVNGLDGALSLDESTAYFVKGTKIYVLTYNPGTLQRINLKTTFTVVYRSFHLVAVSPTNSNSNVNTNANANANTNANGNANGNTNTPPQFGQ